MDIYHPPAGDLRIAAPSPVQTPSKNPFVLFLRKHVSMHPPFYIPDTRVSHDITHHHDCKPTVRRGAAKTALRFIPAPGWPPICPYLVDFLDEERPRLPSGRSVDTRPVLQIVPAPRGLIRDALGRFLIRLGQRMIYQNRPG